MHRLHDGSEKWKDVVDRKIGGGVPVFQYDHCLYYNIIIIHIGIYSLCLYSIVLNMLSILLHSAPSENLSSAISQLEDGPRSGIIITPTIISCGGGGGGAKHLV